MALNKSKPGSPMGIRLIAIGESLPIWWVNAFLMLQRQRQHSSSSQFNLTSHVLMG